ncbi:MAG TPA: hypothetical protein VE172_16015, partial [Stackebrandtia sp.]|uniref:hypothetical protein n=1 Tax=Stackebrandtia sp. TaxID=2023065 RepID=UPI002D71065B
MSLKEYLGEMLAPDTDGDRVPVDLRLAVVAVGVWAAALAALYLDGIGGVVLALVAATAAACLRRGRGGFAIVACALAIGVAAGAAATA